MTYKEIPWKFRETLQRVADTMNRDPLLIWVLPRPQFADLDLANVAWAFASQVTLEEDSIARNPTAWPPPWWLLKATQLVRWLRLPSSPRRGFTQGQLLSLLQLKTQIRRWDGEDDPTAPALDAGYCGDPHFDPPSGPPGALRARVELYPCPVDRFE